jgi:hypothetical protein
VFQIAFVTLAGLTFVYYAAFVSFPAPNFLFLLFLTACVMPLLNLRIIMLIPSKF